MRDALRRAKRLQLNTLSVREPLECLLTRMLQGFSHQVNNMVTLVKRGRRFYALHSQKGIAERIAAKSNIRGNWSAIMRAPAGSREIRSVRPR